MLLELIIASAIGTAELQVNEIPGHVTVQGFGYSIRETDYACSSEPKIDEIKLKLGDICYRVVNKPDFHRIDDRWGWSLWEWIGTKTNGDYIK